MFGRNKSKSSKESSRTRDCSGKANSNIEAGSDMNKKSSKCPCQSGKTQTSKRNNASKS